MRTVLQPRRRVAGLRGSDVARLTTEKRSQIMHAVAQGARNGFQFFYQHFPLHADYFAASARDVPLYRMAARRPAAGRYR